MGASSRLRSFQYVPYYQLNGINTTISPLFNDEYLQSIYKKERISKVNVLKSYYNRLLTLFSVSKFNIIIIEKELFPYLPAIAEWVLKLLNVKYIVDYDDAIFHNYDLSTNAVVKTFLGNKIKHVMKFSYHVTAGNKYIASYAEKSGAKNVSVIPTVIDIKNYSIKGAAAGNKIIIGWIGSPTTLKYLKSLYPVLYYLCSNYPVHVHIIGGKSGIGLLEHESIIEWTEANEVELIKACDIGIMPLEDSPWERGKCGYKLIQYMGCGLPVVASPIGVNIEIVNDGNNGFLAANYQEWIEKMEMYIKDQDLRMQHGFVGRQIVEEKYSLEKTASQIIDILLS